MEIKNKCYHCGDEAMEGLVLFDNKKFCCVGCKTVYQIFNDHDLTDYYQLEATPGITPNEIYKKYAFLANEAIVDKLLDFKEKNIQIVTLYIPSIHCSSCVWVLENLQKINKEIMSSRVHFSKKTVQITYNSKLNLKELVELLSMIGYDPYISLENGEKQKGTKKTETYKLAIAGFCFGNTMFLSFPDYFGKPDVWLLYYRSLFSFLMFIFSLPVVFYASNEYFISAFKGLRKKILNIDVPISIGIVVLFVRSSYEYFTESGQGYFDSLAGLVFFLLLGRFFQKKTYDFLSFERDFKSYFPIAITTLVDGLEVIVPVNDVGVNDVLIIRNGEIIPTDGIVLKGKPLLDYSFVTGESNLVSKQLGEKVFAGGKQQGELIAITVVKTINQSYLTKLWSRNSYENKSIITNITDTVSQYFTGVLLLITILATCFWFYIDKTQIINVVSSVLIVACPCALALSAPFATGNVLRILGKKGFYLKDSFVIERIASIDTMFFDKTGTLTKRNIQGFGYRGKILSAKEESFIKSLVRNSNHPLSRVLFKRIKGKLIKLNRFKEVEGCGLEGEVNDVSIKIGSAKFIGVDNLNNESESRVYISIDNEYKGFYSFDNQYRSHVLKMLNTFSEKYKINILSGDNTAAIPYLKQQLKSSIKLYFHQSPHDKLDHIKSCQQKKQSVLMVGDGLNDAGALLEAEVGIAVAEDVNVFSPASDAIIDAKKIIELPKFIKLCKSSLWVVKISFSLSILYNIVGLYFAITGKLTPLVAAILMPLSSITIVVFVTLTTNIKSRILFREV